MSNDSQAWPIDLLDYWLREKLLPALADLVKAMKVGPTDVRESQPDMGAVISAEHKTRVSGLIDAGEHGGALPEPGKVDVAIDEETAFVNSGELRAALTTMTDQATLFDTLDKLHMPPEPSTFPLIANLDRLQQRNRLQQALADAQAHLVRNEKLAAVGQLTASIAHEINNPIAVMQGNLDLMRETLGPQAEPVRAEIQLLDEQVERMRLIVTQLLQFARPNEYAGYVEAVDPQRALDDCLVLTNHLLARSRKAKVVDRFIDAVRQIEGGYALVALTNKKLIGVRDPLGIRPLVLGDLNGQPVLASESCALDIIGARFVRDIENGEMVVISEDGVESMRPFPAQKMRPCLFEYVYFARPDSLVFGRNVLASRLAALQGHSVPAYRFGMVHQTADGVDVASLSRKHRAIERDVDQPATQLHAEFVVVSVDHFDAS